MNAPTTTSATKRVESPPSTLAAKMRLTWPGVGSHLLLESTTTGAGFGFAVNWVEFVPLYQETQELS
jgi:hypothetical protein